MPACCRGLPHTNISQAPYSSECGSQIRSCASQGYLCWQGGRADIDVCRAERWLKAGTELAQQRPMPAEWYDGWDAQTATGQLSVATDADGAPASSAGKPGAHKEGAVKKKFSKHSVYWRWQFAICDCGSRQGWCVCPGADIHTADAEQAVERVIETCST